MVKLSAKYNSIGFFYIVQRNLSSSCFQSNLPVGKSYNCDTTLMYPKFFKIIVKYALTKCMAMIIFDR